MLLLVWPDTLDEQSLQLFVKAELLQQIVYLLRLHY